jgi:CBS domain-containing protein
MTDFTRVAPVTTRPEVTIDDALEHMKEAGVRSLLVLDTEKKILGVVTSYDIQGEKAIQIGEERRVRHDDITADMLMTGQSTLEVLDMMSVRDAQVGHIVATLKELGRQHLFVLERDPETGERRVRGLFSLSQITKQLGLGAGVDIHAADSLAEIVQTIG